MNYSVVVSEQAAQDMREIFEYIAFGLQSVQNAAGQLARLEKRIYSLEQMPERFQRYGTEPWLSRGLRMAPVDHYCIFYLVNSASKTVQIVRVLYGGRNIDAELKRLSSNVPMD